RFVWTTLFFQAEDGIRDSSVTGVQTCALPISRNQLAVGACARQVRELIARELDVGLDRRHSDARQRDVALGLLDARGVLESRAEIGRASCRGRVEVWRRRVSVT